MSSFSFQPQYNHELSRVRRLLLCGLWASSESLILLGTTAAAGTIAATTVTASAAAALGVGALAVLKGVLIGKHLKRRYRRDVDSMEIDDEAEVAVAKELDSAGCIAKLLCEIEATPADSLTPSMSTFKTAFENPDNLKSSRIEYDQAIALAKDDPKACSVRFNNTRRIRTAPRRCIHGFKISVFIERSRLTCILGYVPFPSHPGSGPSPALPPSSRYKYRALPGTNITLVLSLLQNTSRLRHHHEFSRVCRSPPVRPLGLLRVFILLGTTAAAGTIAATTVTASAAAALGVGALAVLKGVLIGKHLKRRYRRDVDSMEEDVATEIAVAQKMDSAGCVAKLLCEIEAMSADQLTPAMSTFKTAFDNNSNLKGSRGVYDLAITFGSKFAKKDAKACSALFDKCVLSRDDLSFMLDSTFSC
ncbi:hypothetical protein C7M84_010422 [Penaeus vannamei]|uniref:Uncharacterized protein n=1 Tax=Penaeus vannamei TaxID=6689 RepID=A0A423T499_PENVA|nr:hypothetical protein C7M84_010422 [Penaeus vannamei]